MTPGRSSAPYRYSIYGVRVTTDHRFAFPMARDGQQPLADVEFVEGTAEDFEPSANEQPSADEWVVRPRPADGTTYLRWEDLYEFLVAADGSRIVYRSLGDCPRAVLQNFLFGQALAVALVQQGIEPLHAAVVRVDDWAVGFLGDCGFGKSTLLAAFLQDGHPVVTDDMLMLERRSGSLIAYPGSGRLKLMPDSAGTFWDSPTRGTPLTPTATKRSFPLAAAGRQPDSLLLRRLFVLPEPDERNRMSSFEIRPISRLAMVRELLKSSFTTTILHRERLARQFAFATQVASEANGFELRYPAGLQHLPALRAAIVEHVRHAVAEKDLLRRTA